MSRGELGEWITAESALPQLVVLGRRTYEALAELPEEACDGREPFFAGVPSADLELTGHRALDGRVLLVEYRPTGRDIPRA